MNQILLYKSGSISKADKAALKTAGYLPVEVQDINDVVLLFPDGNKLKGDDIFQAAIQSIMGPNSESERRKFGTLIAESLLRK